MKLLILLIFTFSCVASFGQGNKTKVKPNLEATSASTVDSAAIKQLQQEWGKYLDSLYKKTTVKDFFDWFDSHLSHKEYQEEFSAKVGAYYNVWLNNMYNEWYARRQQSPQKKN